MKVTLITVVPNAETQTECSNSVQRALPQGTGEFVEKQYGGIRDTLDLNNSRHRQGLFKDSLKHEFGSTGLIRIGIDPEREEVLGTVRTELGDGDTSRAFLEASVRKTQFIFSAKEYKQLSLRVHMERHEKRRMRMNGGYDQALKELDSVSLKYHEQSMAHADKSYS